MSSINSSVPAVTVTGTGAEGGALPENNLASPEAQSLNAQSPDPRTVLERNSPSKPGEQSPSGDGTNVAAPEKVPASGSPCAEGLRFAQRAKELPIVKCAVGVGDAAMAYGVVASPVWVAKFLLATAASPALALSSPFASLCHAPVRAVDWMLCKGLDVAEAVLPCIAVPPGQMFAATKSCAANCICCRMVSSTAATCSFGCGKLQDILLRK